MIDPRTNRRLLFVLLAVTCAASSSAAGWPWGCRKCKEPPAQYAPCLPNSGFHATRWSRWSEPDSSCESCGDEFAVPASAAPAPFGPATSYGGPLSTPGFGPVPDTSAPFSPAPFSPPPMEPAPLPFTAPTDRPAPLPAALPRLEPEPRSTRDDVPTYETREWNVSGAERRTGEAVPVSHEQSTDVPQRLGAPLEAPRLRPRTVGRPGPSGYYRYRSPSRPGS